MKSDKTDKADPVLAADSADSADISETDDMQRLRMPKLVCLDLDFNIWPLWVDTHVSVPLKRRGKTDVNEIYDRHGKKMAFYSDVPAILAELKERSDVQVAIASRTHAPRACVAYGVGQLTGQSLTA